MSAIEDLMLRQRGVILLRRRFRHEFARLTAKLSKGGNGMNESDDLVEKLAAVEAAFERLEQAGAQLANVAYNICQRGYADAGLLHSLNAARVTWDTCARRERARR